MRALPLLVALLLGCSFNLERTSPRDQSAEPSVRDRGTDARRGDGPGSLDTNPVDARRNDGPGSLDTNPTDARPAEKKPVPDAKKPDAKVPADLKPDLTPKLVSWVKHTAVVGKTANAACGAQHFGGGGACTIGGLRGLWLNIGTDFAATCDQTGNVTAHAACPLAGLTGITYSNTGACATGKVIGGGCLCPVNETLTSSRPDVNGKSWQCACEAGTPQIFAVCANVSTGVYLLGTPCAPYETLLGGGCSCTGSNELQRSEPAVTSWSCQCGGGGSVLGYSICGW